MHIPEPIVEEIMNTSRIEEIVGDFVTLKKRGANMLGLCPFHNEKTPSFTVSPAKNIYKCFGCGKGGNPVNFLMEHESYTYVEALRALAERYNIKLPEEKVEDPGEEYKKASERESILIALKFAGEYYSDLLNNDEEGKTLGMSYFEERGFRPETIQKFGLGYTKNEWNHFHSHAQKAGYQDEFLQKAGLINTNSQGTIYDTFRGRVMFSIHSLSGKIVAFAGRILEKDPKVAKYVNSPETEVYHKSEILYGLFFARQAIRLQDECFLVEGYTDVITLHQAGIENVVASSGTSLTEKQIKLVKRFTENITVLYDGDAAGLKASLRGIDMILEAGLNVRVVVFPDGEDPDSYCKKLGGAGFRDYIKENSKDFILFKSGLLSAEAKDDPVKKAGVIRDIVETISKIPDNLKRSGFIKACGSLLDVQEQLLINEVNKVRRALKKEEKNFVKHEEVASTLNKQIEQILHVDTQENQERDIIRLLLQYGHLPYNDEHTVAEFLIYEIEHDTVEFTTPVYAGILAEYKLKMEELKNPQSIIPAEIPEPEKTLDDQAAIEFDAIKIIEEIPEEKPEVVDENNSEALIEIQEEEFIYDNPNDDLDLEIPDDQILPKVEIVNQDPDTENSFIIDELEYLPAQNIEDENSFGINETEQEAEEEKLFTGDYFVRHSNPEISNVAAGLLSNPYTLSTAWKEKFDVLNTDMNKNYKEDAFSALYRLKLKWIDKLIGQNQEEFKKELTEEQLIDVMTVQQYLLNMRMQITEKQGIVVLK